MPDGIIDLDDIDAILANINQRDVNTQGTTFKGLVFDGLGNRLPGVCVVLGDNGNNGNNCNGANEAVTDKKGFYLFLAPLPLGDTVITFDGSSAADPTTSTTSSSTRRICSRWSTMFSATRSSG